MNKHTEGPWYYDNCMQYVFDSQNNPVAEVCGAGANLPMAANGHLISAAPDMLEVLKAVEWNYYSHHIKTCPCCDWAKDRNHSPDCKLAAALRKARGEV